MYLLNLGKMGFLSCIELGFPIPIMPMLIFGLLSNVCNHHSRRESKLNRMILLSLLSHLAVLALPHSQINQTAHVILDDTNCQKFPRFRGVITTKATKAAALVDFWDCNKVRNGPNSLADLKKKISLFFYQANKTVSFLQNWTNRYYST